MIYVLSKCTFVNLFKHTRNITLLHETFQLRHISFGLRLSLRQFHFCTKINKFSDISQGINLLRFHKINVVSSLALNWKLMCQVSCGGLVQERHRPRPTSTPYGDRPTRTAPWHRPCLLKTHTRSNYLSVILWRIWEIFLTCLRAIRLGITLLPMLMLYPITLKCHSFTNVWYKLLLISLEVSGPIFIKLGQWASTRRDIFSEELCLCLKKLQRENSPHSWFYTSKSFERVFGPNWQSFILLDNGGQPIGSGCCAQVYKGWVDSHAVKEVEETFRTASTRYKYSEEEYENSFCIEVLEMFGIGSFLSSFQPQKIFKSEDENKKLVPVAIKVLHPGMITNLRRDLYIMKVAANILTWMLPSLKWISLPECVDDFTNLMKAQVDLCIEAKNLDIFAKNFAKEKTVSFPRPLWCLTTPFLLVETYEDGRPMEHYIDDNVTTETKAKIADIGVNALLKMVFHDNFSHGDLHPGNMLIQERADYSKVRPWWKFQKKNKSPPFRLVILDCGIVVSLDAKSKKLLRQVFQAVVNGEGELVAELFLNNSSHLCADPMSFKQDMNKLVHYAIGKTTMLSEIEVSPLMTQLFSLMIHHKVKMDGCFSSVMFAMMVVEGVGRSLDPTINMLEKARSYLFRPLLGWE